MAAVVRCVRWTAWRGTPEHVAQIARVCAEAVAEGGRSNCFIDVEVPPYKQTFGSAEAFKRTVAPEAVGDARRISIHARGSRLRADVKFRMGRRQEVVLLIRSRVGSDDPEIVRAVRKISPAIARGLVRRGERAVLIGATYAVFVVASGFGGYFVAAGVDALNLPKWPSTIVTTVGAIVDITAFSFGIALGVSLRPPVEVAPLGQTRLWRFTKLAGPWLGGIIAAGIGKLVFG